MLAMICTGHLAFARDIAYFRFENIEKNKPVIAADSLQSGNEFRAFNDNSSPAISSDVPYEKVPQTGESNQGSLDFTSAPERPMQARDLFLIGSEKNFNPNVDTLEQWTIEASIKFAASENFARSFQTFIGREGYNVTNGAPLQESPLGCLGFKKRGDRNRISIEAWDSDNHYVVVESPDEVNPVQWYSVAATSDGQTLSLWVKSPGEQTYQKKASQHFHGALKNNRGMWTIGRGMFGGQINERFSGWIDEVRFTAAALKPEEMLAGKSQTKPAIALAAKPPATPLPTGDFGSALPMQNYLIHPHDPMIIQQGDEYHVFATHNGINHSKSTDLVHWTDQPSVFSGRPAWISQEIQGRVGLWAPDIAFFNGKYHLYYSASTFGSKRSLIGMATTESLIIKDGKYQWKDEGKVIESFNDSPYNAIDPSLLITPEGAVWMSWGSFNRGLYISEIDPQTGKLKDQKNVTHIASRPGNTAIEAPQLFYHDGWYYLFANYDACCRGAASTYKILVGRSKQITGPYVDRDGKSMLEGNASLVLRSYDHMRGPGHASFITLHGQLMMAHHYYDARRFGVATLAVRPMYFDEAGWPLVGEPIDDKTAATQPVDLSGVWLGLTDDIQPENFTLHPDGSASRGKIMGTWSKDQGKIRVVWKLSDNISQVEQGFLSRDNRSYVARRSDGAIIRARRN